MAASLFSAEAEELVPATVFEDEAGCMVLIFWLSGALGVIEVVFSGRPDEQGKVLVGGRNS